MSGGLLRQRLPPPAQDWTASPAAPVAPSPPLTHGSHLRGITYTCTCTLYIAATCTCTCSTMYSTPQRLTPTHVHVHKPNSSTKISIHIHNVYTHRNTHIHIQPTCTYIRTCIHIEMHPLHTHVSFNTYIYVPDNSLGSSPWAGCRQKGLNTHLLPATATWTSPDVSTFTTLPD